MGVQILDARQTALPLNARFVSDRLDHADPSQANTLNFYAQLMATQVR